MSIRKFLQYCGTLALIVASVYTVNAQPYVSIREYIKSFDADITINKDGTINIIEDITYDFGPNERHGIFRTIPYIKTNESGKKYQMQISDITVEGHKHEVSRENEALKIKIGDADTYVRGVQRYVIRYKVAGALTYFSDHDELYWNVTGVDWQIPIDNVTTRVHFADMFDTNLLMLNCFTGVEGSTESACFMQGYVSELPEVTGNTTRPLDMNEGLTVSVGFPKGLVSVLEPKPYILDSLIWIGLALVSLVSLAVLGWVYFRFYFEWKNTKEKQRIVAAWFSAPKYQDGTEFSPAETVGIVNKSLNHRALTATLIHLAQRGYIKILEEGKKEFAFVKKKEWVGDAEIRDFEKKLLDSIYTSGASKVTYKELKKSTTFVTKISSIYNTILDNLYHQKMFLDKPSTYVPLMALLLVVVLFISLPVFGFLFALIALVFVKHLVRKTDLGVEKYSEAMSLRNFLKSQEEQLDFQAHNQMFFEKLLPYATAFGVEKIWAERFKDLQFQPTDWYESSSGVTSLNSMAYISGLNSLNRGLGNMTSTSSSSGFSSGSGGSSGGGGGGGGGGSW